MITNQDLYRCYSVNLMQYLSENGIKYVLIALDVKSERKMWVYEKTPIFYEHLNKWIANNPKL